MKNKNLRINRGITLISLIITIIVLLILAGVTINLTLGDNGIFTTAEKAAKNYTETQKQELSYLEGFTNEVNNIVNPAPLGTIIKTVNNINYIADGVGNTIPVPVGFSPITSDDQGTKETGFVIKNDSDGNEFVWVPVGNVLNYKRVAWSRDGWEGSQTLNEKTGEITMKGLTYGWTEEMPEDEYNSVSIYGGFYMGRYEAGVKDYEIKNEIREEPLTKVWTAYTGEDTTLVIQDEQKVWNWITRDKAKAVAQDLYTEKKHNVKSKLCSSYAWDSALKFIETNNKTYPTNSIGENYEGELKTTGYYSVNNIYDMGGNAWEWTTESCTHGSIPYVTRSGHFGNSASTSPAAHRGAHAETTADKYFSFRVALYL